MMEGSKMSHAGGSTSKGESHGPQTVEHLLAVGKYAVLGTVIVAALPVLTPVLFVLLLFTITLCFPLGFGIAAFLYIKKRNDRSCRHPPSVEISDGNGESPCSISSDLLRSPSIPSVISKSDADILLENKSDECESIISKSDADMLVEPKSNQSESSVKETRGSMVSGVPCARDQSTRQKERELASSDHGVRRRPDRTRGDGAMTKFQKLDAINVEKDKRATTSFSVGSGQRPVRDSQSTSHLHVESNIQERQSSVPTAGCPGMEQREVMSDSSGRNIAMDFASSSEDPEQSTFEQGQAIPRGPRSHDQVQYGQENPSRMAKKYFRNYRRRNFKS